MSVSTIPVAKHITRISLLAAALSVFLLAGLTIAGPVGAASAGLSTDSGATVSGTLTQFGKPVPNALIRLEAEGVRSETFSDAEGRFVFTAVPAGTYTVVPQKQDTTFLPESRTVVVGGGDVAVETFRSVPYRLPEPKMDLELGRSLPLGGGKGYTLTPDPSDATHVVKAGDVDSLVQTLRHARPGDLVYLPPGEYVFDDPQAYSSSPLFVIPPGVTLFGSRDASIIRTLPVDDVPVSVFTLLEMFADTRISGVTIIGPDTETGPLQGFIEQDGQTIATAYYKPIARGIIIRDRAEVDNISITGFPHVAILLDGPRADGFVHHSYIGENVRTGLGYGVKPVNGAYVEVAFTKFYRNRHSMDSTGGSYYVHDSHFDNENPMGVGVIFQHAQEMSGLIVIQDNVIVNAVRAIHMLAGHGVISGNIIEASNWGIALRKAEGADRHGETYKGFLHQFEVFDNEVRRGNYYIERIAPQDNLYLDGVNVGNLLASLGGVSQTISLNTWSQRHGEWLSQLPATSPSIQIHRPNPDRQETVRGVLDPEFDVDLPAGWRLERLIVRVNDREVYSADALPTPDALRIDTTELPNGSHELYVEARTIHGRHRVTVQDRAPFRTDNYWSQTDELRPPITSGWFGTVDVSQTAEESSGWTFSTGDSGDFLGDHDRKVRKANTDEYLVWETSHLLEATVTLYARSPLPDEMIRLSTSSDGVTWTPVDVNVREDGVSAAGWHRFVYHAPMEDSSKAHWFRLDVLATDPELEVHIGRVEFSGLKER